MKMVLGIVYYSIKTVLKVTVWLLPPVIIQYKASCAVLFILSWVFSKMVNFASTLTQLCFIITPIFVGKIYTILLLVLIMSIQSTIIIMSSTHPYRSGVSPDQKLWVHTVHFLINLKKGLLVYFEMVTFDKQGFRYHHDRFQKEVTNLFNGYPVMNNIIPNLHFYWKQIFSSIGDLFHFIGNIFE